MRWILLLSILILTPAQAKTSHFVYNITADQPVSGQNISDQRSIASLTKLMTAIVVLKNKDKMPKEISYLGHHLIGKVQKIDDLMKAMLVRSDNQAAEALADAWPGGRREFVKAMNQEAENLKLTATKFADSSGLLAENKSTAVEFSKLLKEADRYEAIKRFSTIKDIELEKKIGKRVRVVHIPNTNKKLLFEFDNIVISKTGWTVPAGRCLAMIVEKNQHKYAIVILGEPSVQSREQIARELIYNRLIYEHTHETDR